MKLVVIAGPNGAGKTTAAPYLLRGALSVPTYVNADTIARGLDDFAPERAALAAGKVMLQRLRGLAAERADFAFETTLASRSFAPWIRELIASGYAFHLVFLHLSSPDLAVSRVRDRVEHGGHDVPEATVRRRYERGLKNFFTLYSPVAASWWFHDNSGRDSSRLISYAVTDAREGLREIVVDRETWVQIKAVHA